MKMKSNLMNNFERKFPESASIFDPNFEFAFNYEGKLSHLIALFQSYYTSEIVSWSGSFGQTENNYIDFHADGAYAKSLVEYQYILFVAGKLPNYDKAAQQQVEFARSIREFLIIHKCRYVFTAFFEIG